MAYDSIFNPLPGSRESQLVLYNYRPALSFNIIATVLFGLLAIVHIFWLSRYRITRIIQFWFVFTASWYIVCYVLRSVNHNRPFRSDLFITQYVINMAATNGFIAAIELGLLHGVRVNEHLSLWARLKALTLRNLFMTLTALTFVWQVVAAAMLGVAERRRANGESSSWSARSTNRALLASLAFQLFHLTLFQALVTWLLLKSLSRRNAHAALDRQTTNATGTTAATATAIHAVRPVIKTFLALVFLTMGMLWMRTLYRLIEVAQGFYGKAHSSEALYGVFEFAPVWTAAALWAIKPFGRWIEELLGDHTIRNDKVGIAPVV